RDAANEGTSQHEVLLSATTAAAVLLSRSLILAEPAVFRAHSVDHPAKQSDIQPRSATDGFALTVATLRLHQESMIKKYLGGERWLAVRRHQMAGVCLEHEPDVAAGGEAEGIAGGEGEVHFHFNTNFDARNHQHVATDERHNSSRQHIARA